MTNTFSKIALMALFLGSSCAGLFQGNQQSLKPLDYIKGDKKLDYRHFFDGEVDGFAIVKDQNGNIINKTNNNGKPDDPVTPTVHETFKDYEFTLEELAPFTRFQIKIDMVGTNQAQPPYIKDLRAIALA